MTSGFMARMLGKVRIAELFLTQGKWFIDGVAVTASATQLNAGGSTGNLSGASGQHTVTGGEASNNACDIVTGITTPTSILVRQLSVGGVSYAGPQVTFSGGTLHVAGNPIAFTAGDVINWIITGS